MRHGKKVNHLSRTASHRSAMLSNMASSLILHKRIATTVAKAKALRKYVEPLINRGKDDSTQSRRLVFSYLQDKFAVTELFRDISVKIADRPGGYTRILRTGKRLGDNAEMCIIELVDYNEAYSTSKSDAKATKSRTRRSAKKTETVAVAKPIAPKEIIAEEVITEEVVAEEVIAEETTTEEVISEEVTNEETPKEETETKE